MTAADSRWARMTMKNTRPWVTLAVTYIHISTVLSVHISRLTSPSVVLGGDPLTIDCDFDYQVFLSLFLPVFVFIIGICICCEHRNEKDSLTFGKRGISAHRH